MISLAGPHLPPVRPRGDALLGAAQELGQRQRKRRRERPKLRRTQAFRRAQRLSHGEEQESYTFVIKLTLCIQCVL